MKLILASSSPRRKELLGLLDIKPQILIPEVDESVNPGETTDDFLRRVTLSKGKAVYKAEHFEIPIVSSDTIVVCDNTVIGKPVNMGDAYNMLRNLSGKVHEVLTGVAIRYKGTPHYDYSRTRVEFNDISDEELDYYLANEHYKDKAGAYAIQGKASVFVKKIDGCYFNVMGFPLNLFYNMLKKLGINLFRE